MKQSRSILMALLALIALIALSGLSCTVAYQMERTQMPKPSGWPFMRGNVAGTGSDEVAAYTGKLDVIWERKAGKPVGPITLNHDHLAFPDYRKRISFYDLKTGRFMGKTGTGGIPHTGLILSDSVALVGLSPKQNRIRAINLLKDRVMWQRDLKDANPGPILVDEHLVVSSRTGFLAAYDVAHGDRIWRFAIEALLTAAASYADGKLYQPADPGVLYVISADSGKELYQVPLGGPVVAPPAIDERVYVLTMTGSVYALSPDDGSVVWQTPTEGPLWTAPSVANGRLIFGNSHGRVIALDVRDGHELWRYDAGAVVRAAPLIVGEFVVVGTQKGKVITLRAEDGVEVASTTVKGAVKYGPVTDGRHVYVITQNGRIVCFGESNESTDRPAGEGVRASHEP